MHLYAVKRRRTAWRLALSFVVLAAVLGALAIGSFSVSRTADIERVRALERAIHRSLVSCYAVEGAYPSDVAYLEEHYGLVIDHTKYVVDYETIGSNILPSVTVVPLGGTVLPPEEDTGEGRDDS